MSSIQANSLKYNKYINDQFIGNTAPFNEEPKTSQEETKEVIMKSDVSESPTRGIKEKLRQKNKNYRAIFYGDDEAQIREAMIDLKVDNNPVKTQSKSPSEILGPRKRSISNPIHEEMPWHKSVGARHNQL